MNLSYSRRSRNDNTDSVNHTQTGVQLLKSIEMHIEWDQLYAPNGCVM